MVHDVAVQPEHRDRLQIGDFLINAQPGAPAPAKSPEELYGLLRAALTRTG